MRKLIAIVVCASIVAVSAVIYTNVFPFRHRKHSKKTEKYCFELKYKGIDYQCIPLGMKNDLEVEIKIKMVPLKSNLIIPSNLTNKNNSYKVISVTSELSVNCDTLYIPESVEFFDYDKICANVNYIIVESGNKYYKSVRGNLYHCDTIVYDIYH